MILSVVRFGFAFSLIGIGGFMQGCQLEKQGASNMATGTETNWLRACERDQECGALSCECGVCTQRCNQDDACGLSDAVCSPANGEALGALCPGQPDFDLCLPACSETCALGQVCMGNACIPAVDAGSSTDSSGEAPTGPALDTSTDASIGSSSTTVNPASSRESGSTSALSDATSFVDAASDSGAAGPDGGSGCTLDSCHPERCDELGESCCDPYPRDGANYCNAGLSCVNNTCAELVGTPPEPAQRYCEDTGGSWRETSCGHYFCGQPPACAAVIPGCDCGAERNFAETGCVDDPECSTL